MYGQENAFVTSYTPTHTGDYTITLSWTRADGTGVPIFPESEVDGAVWGWDSATSDPYFDQDLEDLYSGTNPETTTWTDADANHTVYFGVIPYVGDVPWHLVVTFKPTGGSVSTIIDTTGSAPGDRRHGVLAEHGRLAQQPAVLARQRDHGLRRLERVCRGACPVPSRSVPGLERLDRVVPAGYPDRHHHQRRCRRKQRPGGRSVVHGSAGDLAAAGQSPTPLALGGVNGKPGTIAAATCPLWYTYSYPDSTVITASKPAYMWATTDTTSASKRAFASDTATAATLSFKFYGPSVTWVYAKGPERRHRQGDHRRRRAGRQRDRGPVQPPRCSTSTTTWSGLNATAYHTIVITLEQDQERRLHRAS